MEKTISKNIKLEIKINGIKYCSDECPLAYENQCMLGKYLNHSIEHREKSKYKKIFYRTKLCRSFCKQKHFKKNAQSFLYNIPVAVFYQVGYTYQSIKKASQILGTSESNLKWFIYNKDYSVYKNPERKKERIERICAFFDGQNDARKTKIREEE